MGSASYSVRWMFFDIRDEQVTVAYVMLQALGDCPLGVQGCHTQSFPARIPVPELLRQDFLTWPIGPPPFSFDGYSHG